MIARVIWIARCASSSSRCSYSIPLALNMRRIREMRSNACRELEERRELELEPDLEERLERSLELLAGARRA